MPPIVLTDEYIAEIEKGLPVMPDVLREKLQQIQLQSSQIETVIEEPAVAQLAASLADEDEASAKTIINWLTGDITKLNIDGKVEWSQVVAAKEQLLKLAGMIAENKLSSTSAKELLLDVIALKDPETVAEQKNLLQVSDEGAIEKIVAEVLAENEKAAEDVKNGEMKAIGFLVGQVMAKSRGQANPGLAQKIIKQQLNIS